LTVRVLLSYSSKIYPEENLINDNLFDVTTARYLYLHREKDVVIFANYYKKNDRNSLENLWNLNLVEASKYEYFHLLKKTSYDGQWKHFKKIYIKWIVNFSQISLIAKILRGYFLENRYHCQRSFNTIFYQSD